MIFAYIHKLYFKCVYFKNFLIQDISFITQYSQKSKKLFTFTGLNWDIFSQNAFQETHDSL